MSTTSVRPGGRATGGRLPVRPRRPPERAILRVLPAPAQGIGVAVLLLIVLVPVVYVFLASISSDLSVAGGTFLPTKYDLTNYVKIWSTVDLTDGLINSLIVAGTVAGASAAGAASTPQVVVGLAG